MNPIPEEDMSGLDKENATPVVSATTRRACSSRKFGTDTPVGSISESLSNLKRKNAEQAESSAKKKAAKPRRKFGAWAERVRGLGAGDI